MIRLYKIQHTRMNVKGGRYVPNPLIVNERQLRNMLPDSLLAIYGETWDPNQVRLPDHGEADLEFEVGYWAEYHLGCWEAIGWTNHVEDFPMTHPADKPATWYKAVWDWLITR